MKQPLSFGMTMLASALGVVIVSVVGGLISFITMIAMVVAIGNMGSDDAVQVKSGTFVTVDLSHIVGDRSDGSLMQSLSSDKTVGLVAAMQAIRRAADDDKVCGLFIKAGYETGIGWASLEELRGAVDEFKQSGKAVVAYATYYSQPAYYLATASDVISLHPSGMVDFRGMGAQVIYYKDLLDKLGVEMQLIRPESCSYKSAGEVYTMNHMSSANREQIRAYIASIWGTATAAISDSRHIGVDELNSIADNLSGYLASDACASHLVDTLCFEEDVRDMLKECYGGKQLLPIEDYAKNNQAIKQSSKQAIAVVYAEGNVMDGSGKGLRKGVYGDDIVKALKQAMNDDDVKAIVLRVNSPGGQVTASESMTHAVMQARSKKPVVVSMGDFAASAGYEMSCMADVIVAQPMTVTGSIGVFATAPSAQKLLQKKLGVNVDTVNTNSNSTSITMARPYSPAAMQMMTRNVEDFYKVFVGRVAEGRHMTYDAVHQIARGRVWTGVDAKKLGLVDTLGGLELALDIASQRASIDNYTIKDYPEEKDTWSQLMDIFGNSDDNDLNLLTKMRLALRWKVESGQWKALEHVEADLHYVSTAEGLQARLPFVIITD